MEEACFGAGSLFDGWFLGGFWKRENILVKEVIAIKCVKGGESDKLCKRMLSLRIILAGTKT